MNLAILPTAANNTGLPQLCTIVYKQAPILSYWTNRIARIQERKEALIKIAAAISAIEREDSVQRIAFMPVAERDEYLKKLVRKQRKEKGYKDDGNDSGGGAISL